MQAKSNSTLGEASALRKPTIEQFAKMFGCTVEQVNALKAKNKAQLTEMYNQACRTGKRVNGYNAEQLRQLITGLNIP